MVIANKAFIGWYFFCYEKSNFINIFSQGPRILIVPYLPVLIQFISLSPLVALVSLVATACSL